MKPGEQKDAGKAAVAAVQQKSAAGMQQVSAQEEPAKPFVPENKAAQSSLKERSGVVLLGLLVAVVLVVVVLGQLRRMRPAANTAGDICTSA